MSEYWYGYHNNYPYAKWIKNRIMSDNIFIVETPDGCCFFCADNRAETASENRFRFMSKLQVIYWQSVRNLKWQFDGACHDEARQAGKTGSVWQKISSPTIVKRQNRGERERDVIVVFYMMALLLGIRSSASVTYIIDHRFIYQGAGRAWSSQYWGIMTCMYSSEFKRFTFLYLF